ncbi:MAG: hypothetical protein IJ752_07165 [Alphaproteobacteria bacterium]|nr:hypothetical protein [Alphaproteobacteria bacterium]
MKYFIAALFLPFLSGCWLTATNSSMPFGAAPLTVWGAGEAISYLATGKIMEDNAASFFTGKDCSLGRKLSGEGKYCMTTLELERANKPAWSVQKIYCYQSLAAPTCYTQPSPYPTDTLIGIYDKPVYPNQSDQ